MLKFMMELYKLNPKRCRQSVLAVKLELNRSVGQCLTLRFVGPTIPLNTNHCLSHSGAVVLVISDLVGLDYTIGPKL